MGFDLGLVVFNELSPEEVEKVRGDGAFERQKRRFIEAARRGRKVYLGFVFRLEDYFTYTVADAEEVLVCPEEGDYEATGNVRQIDMGFSKEAVVALLDSESLEVKWL